MAVIVEKQQQQTESDTETLGKGRRLFSRLMKEDCWKMSRSVPGRDPTRWKFDAVGNIVCRALTSCFGPLCHEYDHIAPHSKGGETSVENCQILQTRINRLKSDSVVDLQSYQDASIKYEFSNEELDLVEIAVYGNVARAVSGPLPGFSTSTILCECLNNGISNKSESNNFRPTCQRPDYTRHSPIKEL